jgi:hypothetical protein
MVYTFSGTSKSASRSRQSSMGPISLRFRLWRDLMLAIPTLYDQPDLGRGSVPEGHRRTRPHRRAAVSTTSMSRLPHREQTSRRANPGPSSLVRTPELARQGRARPDADNRDTRRLFALEPPLCCRELLVGRYMASSALAIVGAGLVGLERALTPSPAFIERRGLAEASAW